jgi:hypothetical protein
MDLEFFPAVKSKAIKEIYDYTIDAFSDTPDFKWNLEEIQNEVKDGWSLCGVRNKQDEIVAAVFYRLDKKKLMTKNTGLKIDHQGSGYSHAMKEFFEKTARGLKAKSIVHYCRIDNFRMYSLNESHGYEKTGCKADDEQIVEWEKVLK